MTDLDKALAAAREALAAANSARQWQDTPLATLDAIDALDDLLAALDAAQREPNKPINELLVEYENDGCNFIDTEWVKQAALRYVKTMPDSQARCLLYVLASAPPAAPRDETPIDIGGESVPRWVVGYADALATYFAERGGGSWAIGGVQSREKAPPAAADELSIAAHGKRMYVRGFDDGQKKARISMGVVPAGYALVPVEPTEAMLKAGEETISGWWGGQVKERLFVATYRAMLAANKENTND